MCFFTEKSTHIDSQKSPVRNILPPGVYSHYYPLLYAFYTLQIMRYQRVIKTYYRYCCVPNRMHFNFNITNTSLYAFFAVENNCYGLWYE